ncbi:response regulator transcription factor [Enterobacter bugandensis]|uniref:response regulator transcription factor n=1 Tax=Enterobacter bugandensis TaxID=881260 RepID=UPI002DB708D2|nr:response regulator transcription factor [Enterobacter bugandensis]WRU09478.1 response regulator transcription factor [Enterobacter bugandensis]
MSDRPANVIRVAVLDDHPMIRNAFEFSLAGSDDMRLVAACASRHEMLTVLRNQEVDVLVLDYLLGENDVDGLVLIKQLLGHFPRLKILVSSSVESPGIVQLILRAGGRGFIGKSKSFGEIAGAIRTVAAGEKFITDDMHFQLDKIAETDGEMKMFIQPPAADESVERLLKTLTPREMEVIRCYLTGMSLAQIALKFARHVKTISGQKQSALRKLGLRSDAELFLFKDHIL